MIIVSLQAEVSEDLPRRGRRQLRHVHAILVALFHGPRGRGTQEHARCRQENRFSRQFPSPLDL
ncbi:MAG: hypothetical protein MZV70_34560 [Desulfobacterales bacterium]|nr:hypothetical protein [Desulfobacterales bacterium]